MGSNAQLAQAKEAISQLLQVLKISQLVYVDDIFEEVLSVEPVIGDLIAGLQTSPEKVKTILPEIPLDLPDDILGQEFRDLWLNLDPARQKDVASEIAEIAGSQVIDDSSVATQLRALFPEDLFFEMSPATWLEREEEILARASSDAKVMCLFDQDLSRSEGFTSSGGRSGIGLLWNVVNGRGESVICGLLTHTIPLDNEMDAWMRLAPENGLDSLELGQFLPLSKERLRDDSDPRLLADGIKKAVLNTFCENLKRSAAGVLVESHDNAIEDLAKLDPYAFDRMIFRASREEGVWEAETIIRIFQIFQQDEMRSLLSDSRKSKAFNAAVERARPISAIKTIEQEDERVSSQVIGLRRRELYEEEHLIKHSPLQVGDIFELISDNGNHVKFVLLAQPCDLMIRDDGGRGRDDIIVPLVPIDEKITYNSAHNKRPPKYWNTRAAMTYFYKDTNAVAILGFSKACWVSMDVLDLSVLDIEGACRIDLTQQIDPPPQLTIGWRFRIDELIKLFKTRRAQLEELQSHIKFLKDEGAKENLWKAAMPKLDFGNLLPAVSYAEGAFDYRLKRVGRYRQPGANSLLKAFTRYLSREAEDFDLAKPNLRY